MKLIHLRVLMAMFASLVLIALACTIAIKHTTSGKRLYGWDVSVVAPDSWIVTPAYSDGEQRPLRSTNASDESVIFQSTSTTIFRGGGQHPAGPYTSDEYAMIIAERLPASSTIPTGAIRRKIGGIVFDFKSDDADSVGPSDDDGYYYTSQNGRVYRLSVWLNGWSDVELLEKIIGTIQ